MDYHTRFEHRLYQVVNELRSLARGLGDIIAQRLYETLSQYQDMVIDYGINVSADEDFIVAFRQGQELIHSHHEVIRDWRRDGVIS